MGIERQVTVYGEDQTYRRPAYCRHGRDLNVSWQLIIRNLGV